MIDAKIEWVKLTAGAGSNGYGDPRGMPNLRQNLSDYYNERYNLNGWTMTPDDLVVTTGGSSHALSLSFEMLMRNQGGKGELLIPSPFFGPYTGMCLLANGTPVLVDTDSNFELDLEKMEGAITSETKAILINSPNNPTGKIYSYESIQKMIDLCRKHNLALISDEVYERFTYHEDKKFHSLIEFFATNMDVNLITNTSPSKTYGMIGDRVGYMVGNQRQFIKDVTITLGYRFASAPYLAQHALDSVFKPENRQAIDKYIQETSDSYKAKGEVLVGAMRAMGFSCIDIEGGMFLMVEVKSVTGMDGMELSTHMMNQEYPIAITPGEFFGPSYKDYVRMTTCPKMDTIEKGVKQLGIYVAAIKERL